MEAVLFWWVFFFFFSAAGGETQETDRSHLLLTATLEFKLQYVAFIKNKNMSLQCNSRQKLWGKKILCLLPEVTQEFTAQSEITNQSQQACLSAVNH